MNDFQDRLSRHVANLTPEQSAPFREVLARREQRRRRRRALVAGGTAMVAVTAIAIGTQLLGPGDPRDSGGPATSSPSPTETQRPEPTYEWSKQPSPVVLRLGGRDVELKPWSYCWDGPPNSEGIAPGVCADGYAQTKDLERVGSPGSVDFWFGVEGWDFQATFTELGVDCPRQHTVQGMRTGDQTFRLDPAGPPGRYRVDLFGRGRHGSVSTSFLWTTPTDGPTDQPAAYIALVSGDGDELWAYQLEVGVQDLAFQPQEADVEVTATAANGRSMTLDAELEDHGECYAEGSLFFRGAQDPAQQAAQLGPAPFTYEVLLTLDSKQYVGTAVWPRDEKEDEAPNTVLTFDPPLPAYTVE
jgi:hypothetical protein